MMFAPIFHHSNYANSDKVNSRKWSHSPDSISFFFFINKNTAPVIARLHWIILTDLKSRTPSPGTHGRKSESGNM